MLRIYYIQSVSINKGFDGETGNTVFADGAIGEGEGPVLRPTIAGISALRMQPRTERFWYQPWSGLDSNPYFTDTDCIGFL